MQRSEQLEMGSGREIQRVGAAMEKVLSAQVRILVLQGEELGGDAGVGQTGRWKPGYGGLYM